MSAIAPLLEQYRTSLFAHHFAVWIHLGHEIGLAACYLLGPSGRKGQGESHRDYGSRRQRAAAATPMVLLEWSAIAPHAIGASPPAPVR
jgi:hypothetical protein